jgi:hypothetical protein
MRYLPDNNLSYPILITLDDGSQGSGFYLSLSNDNADLYIVTARHVIYKNAKVNDSDPNSFVLKAKKLSILSYGSDFSISSTHISEIDLELLDPKNIKFSEKHDVAIIRIGTAVQRPNSELRDIIFLPGHTQKQKPPQESPLVCVLDTYFKKYEDVLVSNEVVMFGYPVSLGNGIDYARPLLRKGIVAGKNQNNRTIIIDCPSYQGNSGGLVLEIDADPFNRKSRAIGVVGGFVPFIEIFESLHFKYKNTSVENSGYSIVTPIDVIFELINTHDQIKKY